MWHPDDNIGMECTARNMAVRVYPNGRFFKDAEEFGSTFGAVAGHFGAHGKDMPKEELNMWLDGSKWKSELARRATRIASAEDADQKEMRKENSTDNSARTQSMK
jgi:hypothetical protein